MQPGGDVGGMQGEILQKINKPHRSGAQGFHLRHIALL